MKNLSEFILTTLTVLACFTSAQVSSAQTPETYGFLNLANIIPGDKPCQITLGGKEVVPKGLPSAQATGWFIVPSGSANLSLEVEGMEGGSGSINIGEHQSSVYVIYLEAPPKRPLDDKPPKPKIRIKRCDALSSPGGFYLKAMSFLPGDNRLMFGQNPVDLTAMTPTEIPKWGGGGIKISMNQKPLGETLPVTEKGAFYLFIGTDHVDKFCSLLVRSDSQELPPWMKKK